ncbi:MULTISPECIES: hypothetical protein [unclassified Pseudomonas]|uniref:BufA2 family periplasmic bufferin-type metallophore n=1 Tax=unclassified Pseudomonas TaxID=196821 RepID=UPI002AC8AACA|nr:MULTISPECIES: hypothetical protein [unclassified Pseudomonas]MEB0047094.1 hypothetical protein [Pseudomonas sp. Dout3]MEB0098493.1 hypothetical protein [Pseudomonas sp. DC1.2]WPX58911.1 hypothetical protein RHM68_25595 [Pseudomonas sp. DC1.2]
MTFKTAAAGAALALAAATMFAGVATQVQAADAVNVHCYGVTSCKGMNDCKTVDNACKGQAACKGHGFKAMTQDQCAKEGGKVGE